jgi:hypothetical protein
VRSAGFLLIGMLLYQGALVPRVGLGAGMAGDFGTAELTQKIAALRGLQEEVAARIVTAVGLRADLTARGREFAAEVQDIQRGHRYAGCAEAVRNPRVQYNLKLIQMVFGYTGALDEKIVFFEDGLEQIRFLCRQAEDEFKMMQTLGALETGGLVDRINRLLIEYQAEMKKDLIVPAGITPRSCEGIWQEIVDDGL